MPAIPVYARVEAAMSDDELKALAVLLRHLLQDSIYGLPPVLLVAAKGDRLLRNEMIGAAFCLRDAVVRSLRERNLTV